jgi:hypothetical protein
MTTIAALIPRIRYRTGRVVAIRCATCRAWRKPRHFNRNTNTCRACCYGQARRRITARADRRG